MDQQEREKLQQRRDEKIKENKNYLSEKVNKILSPLVTNVVATRPSIPVILQSISFISYQLNYMREWILMHYDLQRSDLQNQLKLQDLITLRKEVSDLNEELVLNLIPFNQYQKDKKQKHLKRQEENDKYDDKDDLEEEKIGDLSALPRLSFQASTRVQLTPTKAKIHLEPHMMHLERRKSQSKMTASLDMLFNRIVQQNTQQPLIIHIIQNLRPFQNLFEQIKHTEGDQIQILEGQDQAIYLIESGQLKTQDERVLKQYHVFGSMPFCFNVSSNDTLTALSDCSIFKLGHLFKDMILEQYDVYEAQMKSDNSDIEIMKEIEIKILNQTHGYNKSTMMTAFRECILYPEDALKINEESNDILYYIKIGKVILKKEAEENAHQGGAFIKILDEEAKQGIELVAEELSVILSIQRAQLSKLLTNQTINEFYKIN
ncbi:UNKNOWN [Stylonychia lemnae]|uniref:Cyclic nucleotide-binding domain-containing protein n=1 Tax=Stylonychia lemnae TaxID=5949 RepID=A0A078AWM5_STYLE|nr:UNKNOWN [Stylonychia lemnae]|eukprot:CDW86860.1 UNKNOWN [Stylonychia lemnae]